MVLPVHNEYIRPWPGPAKLSGHLKIVEKTAYIVNELPTKIFSLWKSADSVGSASSRWRLKLDVLWTRTPNKTRNVTTTNDVTMYVFETRVRRGRANGRRHRASKDWIYKK